MAAARRSELGGVRDVGFTVPCLSLSSSVSYDGGGDEEDFSQALTDLCRMAFASTTDDQIDSLAGGSGHNWLTVDDSPIHPTQPLLPPSLQGPFANAELLLQHGGGVVGGREMMGGNGGRRLGGGRDGGGCDRSAAMYVQQYGGAIGGLGGGGGLAPQAMVRDSMHGQNPLYYTDDAFDQPLGGSICNDVLLPGGTGSPLSTGIGLSETLAQSTAHENAAYRRFGELHYALDIPLLSDDDDPTIQGNYLMLTDDLSSMPSGSLVREPTERVQTNCQQVLGQLTMPQMSSGCTVASMAEQRDESIANYLTGAYTDDVQRISEASRSSNPTRSAAVGSRKVLKANRRLKEKNAPTAAQSTTQTSVPKPMAEKSNQARVTRYVVKCLMDYGICVVDRYMGLMSGTRILNEVQNLEVMGLFQEGQLICKTGDTQTIRGDRIMWVERDSDKLKHITVLIRQLDNLLESLNGQIVPYRIKSRSKAILEQRKRKPQFLRKMVPTRGTKIGKTSRLSSSPLAAEQRVEQPGSEETKAMVACYPGHGRGYMRHVDNATQDGRCITCIYYLNKDWNVKVDGGLLRMFPTRFPGPIDVEPMFDRLLLFWSDHRNPHEVQPAYRDRYAITVWYFDEVERQQARHRHMQQEMQEPHYGMNENRLTPISLSCG